MENRIENRVAHALGSDPDIEEAAKAACMTPAQLRSALKGKLPFSAQEIHLLAKYAKADERELVFGDADQYALTGLAARHAYHSDTGQRSVEKRDQDRETINRIHFAYRQAGELPASTSLPREPAEVMAQAEPGFVTNFLNRVEERFGVDVIRLSEISTAYSFMIGERQIILVPQSQNWFYQNYCLAHELGHIARGHRQVLCGAKSDSDALASSYVEYCEKEANEFAAELLMPAKRLKEIDWPCLSNSRAAEYLWIWGVSTLALRHRLSNLSLYVPKALEQGTYPLLRKYIHDRTKVTSRSKRADTRRFPRWLVERHRNDVRQGMIPPDTIEWMTGERIDEEICRRGNTTRLRPDELQSLFL